MSDFDLETWESYFLDREIRKIARSSNDESFIQAFESICRNSSTSIDTKTNRDEISLDWMNPGTATLISNVMRSGDQSIESLVRKSSMIVNHYSSQKCPTRDEYPTIDTRKIIPLSSHSDSSMADDDSLFTVPNITVKLNELMDPPLATVWLPGSCEYVSSRRRKMINSNNINEESYWDETGVFEMRIKDDEHDDLNIEQFRSHMYNSMKMTISRDIEQPIPLIWINRQKMMKLSIQDWCELCPSSSLFQILSTNMDSSNDPAWEILTRTSRIISFLASTSPSRNCGFYIISVLLPTSLQILSTCGSSLLSEGTNYLHEICTEISTVLVYRFELGISSKSELFHLLTDLYNSDTTFATSFWLEITRAYFDYHN